MQINKQKIQYDNKNIVSYSRCYCKFVCFSNNRQNVCVQSESAVNFCLGFQIGSYKDNKILMNKYGSVVAYSGQLLFI
jgi:hypothetical protein